MENRAHFHFDPPTQTPLNIYAHTHVLALSSHHYSGGLQQAGWQAKYGQISKL